VPGLFFRQGTHFGYQYQNCVPRILLIGINGSPRNGPVGQGSPARGFTPRRSHHPQTRTAAGSCKHERQNEWWTGEYDQQVVPARPKARPAPGKLPSTAQAKAIADIKARYRGDLSDDIGF
jgi:hypothetical protein